MNKTIPILFLLSYVVGGGFGLILPRVENFREKRRNLIAKRKTLENREEYIDHLEDLSNEIRDREEEMKKVNQAFPDHPETSWFAEFLQKTVPQSGMILKDVGSFSTSVSETSEGQKVVTTEIKIKVRGGYEAFLSLLERLERSVRLIEIEEVTFQDSTVKGVGSVPQEEAEEGEGEEGERVAEEECGTYEEEEACETAGCMWEDGSCQEEGPKQKVYDFSLTCKVRSGEFNSKEKNGN